ncbi:cytochrome c [Denitratisoma sp. agr-D3]
MRTLFCCLSLSSLLVACGPVQDTRPGQPVAHRQAAFKAMLKTFEPMGVMLREEDFKADRFRELAKDLVTKREGPWQYFGADTNYPPSHAKAGVWETPEKFESAKQEFMTATDQLLVAAEKGERGPVEKAYSRVHESCKACHKQFKD